MREEHERFGVSLEIIRQILDEHAGIIRLGCYVPTRTEVRTQEPAWLESVLIDWWWESPTQLTPTYWQVQEVLGILTARPDADSEGVQRIIDQAPTEDDFGPDR